MGILGNDCAKDATLSSDCLFYTITDTLVETETPPDLMCTGKNLSKSINEVARSSTFNDHNVTGIVNGVLASTWKN